MRSYYVNERVEALEARLSALEQQISCYLPETEIAAQPAEEEDAAALRGRCPCCGADVLSEIVYVERKGYIIRWRCSDARCDYVKVL